MWRIDYSFREVEFCPGRPTSWVRWVTCFDRFPEDTLGSLFLSHDTHPSHLPCPHPLPPIHGTWSLVSILGSLSNSQPILENQCTKVYFRFLQSMHIKPSHILLLNTRRCTKSWPNPWPQFSSLLLTSSPATNYSRYVREGQCGFVVGKLKKLQTSWPDRFHPLCAFGDSQHLLKAGNRVSSSVPTLLFMLVLQRQPQGITTFRVSQSHSDEWWTLSQRLSRQVSAGGSQPRGEATCEIQGRLWLAVPCWA